jgi:hypothetical protein
MYQAVLIAKGQIQENGRRASVIGITGCPMKKYPR